jgi:hypothetical protein
MPPSRVDSNQSIIVAALRAAGASVLHLHTVGHGCPDLAVGHAGRNYLVEIKRGTAKLTPDEQRFHSEWRGVVHVIRTPEEALEMLGGER